MTSFELFKLLKFEKKSTSHIYFYTFSPEIYYMWQVTSIHEKNQIFCIIIGIKTSAIIKLCKKSCRKEKVGGA